MDNKQKTKGYLTLTHQSCVMESDRDPSSPGSGSGVWEKSENSKWIVVAETKHRIPRRARVRTVASVDPSLGIREFITSFEEEPEASVASSSILVGDGSSLVRLDSAGENMEGEPQQGPSSGGDSDGVNEAVGGPGGQEEARVGGRQSVRQSRRRRQKRSRRMTTVGVRRLGAVSVESSPGRDSPSPESLSRIVMKYASGLTSFC